jgi:hypothetical protein
MDEQKQAEVLKKTGQIADLGRVLAGFESLEDIGPKAIQAIGHAIVGWAIDIRHVIESEG